MGTAAREFSREILIGVTAIAMWLVPVIIWFDEIKAYVQSWL